MLNTGLHAFYSNDNRISYIEKGALEKLKHLTTINLENNLLKRFSFHEFPSTTSEIMYKNNSIDLIYSLSSAEFYGQLKRLDLSFDQISRLYLIYLSMKILQVKFI
jgi:hypothetical protein